MSTTEEVEKEILEIGHRGPQEGEVIGDKELANKPRPDERFDDATINRWKNQLKIEYPDIDEGLMNIVLQSYKYHPDIVKEINEEYRNGMHQTDPKERIQGGTVIQDFEVGNDLI